MLGISLLAVFVFYQLTKKYLATQNQRLLALILLTLNPVYLYWSLRIYADVPFSLLVMLCFYVFELWRESMIEKKRATLLYPALMGLICGLSILTRFEGYLLALATFIGIVFIARKKLTQWLVPLLIFALTTVLVVLPWLIYRNPLTSSYFEETSGRKYDLEMFLTYIISYIFVLGIIPAGALVWIRVPGVIKRYPHIVAFVLLESILILAWPAAVPRLFVPIIPLLILAFVSSRRFASRSLGGVTLTAIILVTVYVVSQNHLRLQFLGAHTLVFMFVSAVSALMITAIFFKRRWLFMILSVLSMLALSASIIYSHKDVYRSIKEIAQSNQLSGNIIHNDTAGIVNWYLPQSDYKNLDDKKYLSQGYLQENDVDYIILTNEFNPNLDIDLKKRPYLELVKESKHLTGGKMFFTWLLKAQQ